MYMYPRGLITGIENVCVWVGVGGGGRVGLLLDVFFCLRVDECITGGTVL